MMQSVFLPFFHCNNPVQAFSQAVENNNQHLKKKFNPQQTPYQLLLERADFIDKILSACWHHFFPLEAEKNSLIATGGYGRHELFPHSDIDIALLLQDKPNDHFKEALSNFNNFLWDIGLKPGLTVRTIDESIEEARKDQTILTSLMEMRFICGNRALSEKLQQKIDDDHSLWPSKDFFLAKMAEQRKRHKKFHNTAYKLEPNIKEGPGGIRDLQIISWVFKHHYHAKTLRELIKYRFLLASEYNELIQARDILWRLRFALHCLTDRAEDRLLFDYQRELAQQFGFTQSCGESDVEQFMQFYFKTVVNIEQLNEMLLQLFNERFILNQKKRKAVPISKDFSIINGYIQVNDTHVFKQNPLALFEIFLLQQQLPSSKGIRASTIRLIRKHINSIDESFRHNPKANQLFLRFFRQGKGLTHQLRHMNRYGILAAYLPCFANIVARMQYDLFHIYTVDEHTLFLVRNLRRFALDKHNDELPFCNNIFLLIPKPELLYLAGLFHDIGKGQGGNHSLTGAEITRQFCLQHQIPESDSQLIIWLVRNHLLMSLTAQKKDIADPEVIHDFARQVGTVKKLNYLYLLTVADIRATNPELWNDWKDRLLRDLYIATHNALHRGLENPIEHHEIYQQHRQEAIVKLQQLGLPIHKIQRCWKELDAEDDYFIRYSSDEITWHTLAISSVNNNQLPLVLLRPETLRGSVEIFVYAKNDEGLFSICAASLEQLGLTILDARIITTRHQYILNSFQVLQQSGEAIGDIYQEVQIVQTLKQNLLHKKLNQPTGLLKQSRQARYFPIKTRISYLKDPYGKYTIIEIVTTDRIGLLSLLSQSFKDFHLHIHNAKITTIGSRAEDVFYLSDADNRMLEDDNTLEELKQHIYDKLEEQAN
jgi:[protein-PII] uridylyltransferase